MSAAPPWPLAETRSSSRGPSSPARFRCASTRPRPRAAPARRPARRWRSRAPSQNDSARRNAQAPVEGLARAAVEIARGTVQHQRFGRAPHRTAKDRSPRPRAPAFHTATGRRVFRRRFVAVQLRHVQRRPPRDLLHARGNLVHENADAAHSRAGGDFRRPFGRNVARAAWVKVEPDGGGAAVHAASASSRVGDAADLQDHAATSRRSARFRVVRFHQVLAHQERGVPGIAQPGDIAGVRMPAFRSRGWRPPGMCSARRSDVSSVTSKVAPGLRLFTPDRGRSPLPHGHIQFPAGRALPPGPPFRKRAARSRKSRISRSASIAGNQQKSHPRRAPPPRQSALPQS